MLDFPTQNYLFMKLFRPKYYISFFISLPPLIMYDWDYTYDSQFWAKTYLWGHDIVLENAEWTQNKANKGSI